MRRGYSRLFLQLFRISFLIFIVRLDVDGFPHKASSKSRGNFKFPDFVENSSWDKSTERFSSTSADDSRENQTWDDVVKIVGNAYHNEEPLAGAATNHSTFKGRPFQRDISRLQHTYAESTSFKKKTTNSSEEQRQLFDNQEESSVEMMQSDGKIIFPTEDDMMPNQEQQIDVRSAPVCQGNTFCERTSYYPEAIINAAIHRNGSLKYLAGIDMVSDIVQRIDATDDAPLCVSDEIVVYPKSAENRQKEWLFVVNQENFKQGVRIETCSQANSACNLVDGFAAGYSTTCRQKYIYRELAAVSSDGSVGPEMFRFPSSCCCHVKFTGNPLTRMGDVSLGEQRSQIASTRKQRKK